MNIKKFNFPKFEKIEKWGLGDEYEEIIGAHNLCIKCVSTDTDGGKSFILALGYKLTNPTNIYTRNIWSKYYEYYPSCESSYDSFYGWYLKMEKDFQEFWKKLILDDYFVVQNKTMKDVEYSSETNISQEKIELPCKVGDTAWVVSRERMYEVLVDGFVVTSIGIKIILHNDLCKYLPDEEIFFDKESAKKAFENMKRGIQDNG